MTARTGKNGKCVIAGTLTKRLTKWSLTAEVDESVWADSDSAGYANALGGRRRATGSIEGKFESDREQYDIMREGDEVKLVLWQSTTAGDYWQFPTVLIKNFEIELDQDTQEVVGWSAEWGSSGIFYAPGQASAPAETLPTS